MTAKEYFLRYITIDTTSDESNPACPSSPNQRVLADLIVKDMLNIGIRDARVDAHGYVYGTIDANCENQCAIGLIAHMDTSDGASGGPIHAREIAYDGGDIVLNEEKHIVLTEKEFPCLSRHKGQNLIVTDGTTLLGADDKAGVAEIMALCEEIILNPDIKHGKICIGFTPDEEIGRGADLFDIPAFGADYAYTVDGGAVHEMEYENFNAAALRVTVHGRNIHPGSAKDRMRNAARMAMQFHAMLPPREIPENTEGYEGFYHLTGMKGDETQAEMTYIIRDHDMKKFLQKKERVRKIADYLNDLWGEDTVEIALRDSYYNMREKIEKRMEVVERAMKALKAEGLSPAAVPIRGGTDGARLTDMGLPCPNLGTGGCCGHGVHEHLSVDEMEKMVGVLKRLVSAE